MKARDLAPGVGLKRGDAIWTVINAYTTTDRIGGPSTIVRAAAPDGIRELTLPAELEVATDHDQETP